MITVQSLHIAKPILLEKSVSGYRMSIRNLTRGFWNGTFNYFEFYEGMWRAIESGFTQAWVEGMVQEGMTAEDMNADERIRLTQEIMRERSFINGFATAIEINSKAHKGKLEPLMRRAEQWANAYTRILALARTYAGRDKKYEWVIDAPKESCASCKKLNGQVRRMSFWRAKDVYPKNWAKLLCDGGCKCSHVPTDKPSSHGPLPALP